MKIGIIGLGLIGGSLLKVLSKQNFELYAVTRNQDTLKEVAQFCVEASNDMTILKECEIVFVCTPMSNVLDILKQLGEIVSQDTIVTDVSSLKGFVMEKTYPFQFIGSHPMAGTEHSGYTNSFDTLFVGAKWVVTPFKDTEKSFVDKLTSVIQLTGAEVIFAEAKKHDETVAKISHMPMLLAQALFEAVKDDELALKLASSGFRDMTRLAMSNVDMAEDMILMNNKNIKTSLAEVEQAIKYLKTDYKEKITQIRFSRAKMYDKNGKNIL